jgi:hypothetical protein
MICAEIPGAKQSIPNAATNPRIESADFVLFAFMDIPLIPFNKSRFLRSHSTKYYDGSHPKRQDNAMLLKDNFCRNPAAQAD